MKNNRLLKLICTLGIVILAFNLLGCTAAKIVNIKETESKISVKKALDMADSEDSKMSMEEIKEKYKDEPIAFVKYKDKWGIINTKGKWVIKPKFNFKVVGFFNEGLADALNSDNKWGYINKFGEWVIEPKFPCDNPKSPDDVTAFHDGMACVEINDKYGYINKKGEIVIEPKYYTAWDFNEGLGFVAIKKNHSFYDFFIDKTGKPVIEFEAGNSIVTAYAQYNFSEDVVFCENENGLVGYINKNREWVIEPRFHGASDFSEGLAAASIKSKFSGPYGYIDKTGDFVIEPKFEVCFPFNEDVASVILNDKYGLINRKGEFLAQPIYERMNNCSDGLIAVRLGSKWGYINKKGEIVVKPKFDDTYDFHNGFADVKIGEKYGYIDYKGNHLTDVIFDNTRSFTK